MVRARWALLAGALLVAALGATWGTGVFGNLSSGGFYAADSPSAKTRAQIIKELGPQDADVLALYSSPTLRVVDPAFRSQVQAVLARLAGRPEVASVVSYYQGQPAELLSRDGHATYLVVRLRTGGDDRKLKDYNAIRGDLAAGGGLRTQLGGVRPFTADANALTTSDIERAEAFSMPILLVLLVVIFGGVVAASTPLVIGGLAILGGFIVTRLLSELTTVSTFAVNIITLIGLGLSIDYALFVVSRFREELPNGTVPQAIARTMATAGRTVAVSGVTITLALASLMLFPDAFLKSMAYGGMAAVAIAMLATLTALPALLAVLGPRVNALRVRRAPRTARAPAGAAGRDVEERGAWAALARSVMRHPWWYLVSVLVVLAVLAAPVNRIHVGGVDERVLPPNSESRVVSEAVQTRFPAADPYPIEVFATGLGRASAATLLGQLAALPGVNGATVAASSADAVLVDVSFAGDATSSAARDLVKTIRALPPPAGGTLGVTGYSADLEDQLTGLAAALPWMVLFVVLVTLVLLFLAFGSVLLPIKAVLLNAVSLGAAFGAVVFVFQQGHFASWLRFTPTGSIEPTDPVLMVAVLFGLATDYEVFLLSRVREEWDRGADNTTAVATGLQRTGRIITSAALLLVIVVAGFATGDIEFIKLIGVGMAVAIVVDATLVRALLVPATMRLLGRWNWWAPGPLARLYRRYGHAEVVEQRTADAVQVG